MSKERLEDITRKFLDEGYVYNRSSSEPQQFDYDMKWVLEYAKEQNERLQELESELEISQTKLTMNEEFIKNKYIPKVKELTEQNKRYREELESILSYNHTEMSVPEDVIESIKQLLESESE